MLLFPSPRSDLDRNPAFKPSPRSALECHPALSLLERPALEFHFHLALWPQLGSAEGHPHPHLLVHL
jgi:hypothetical protein